MIKTIPSFRVIPVDIKKLLLKMGACKSGQEAIRLINQGAVNVSGERVRRVSQVCHEDVIQVGKRFWRRLMNTETMTVETYDDRP